MIKLQEKWVTIEGYPNYILNNSGSVKNIITGRVLKPTTTFDRQHKIKPKSCSFKLSSSGKQKTFHAHILVMKYFGIQKPEIQNISIDHINRNPIDNRIENLRWATPKIQAGNKKRIIKTSIKLTMQDIENIYIKTKSMTFKQIANEIGIDKTSLQRILTYVHPDY